MIIPQEQKLSSGRASEVASDNLSKNQNNTISLQFDNSSRIITFCLVFFNTIIEKNGRVSCEQCPLCRWMTSRANSIFLQTQCIGTAWTCCSYGEEADEGIYAGSLLYPSALLSPPFHNDRQSSTAGQIVMPREELQLTHFTLHRCTPASYNAASTTVSTTSPPSPWSPERRVVSFAVSTNTSRVPLDWESASKNRMPPWCRVVSSPDDKYWRVFWITGGKGESFGKRT